MQQNTINISARQPVLMLAYGQQRLAQDISQSTATCRHEMTVAETRPWQNACRGCGSC